MAKRLERSNTKNMCSVVPIKIPHLKMGKGRKKEGERRRREGERRGKDSQSSSVEQKKMCL
jgi:hypothetical protein